MVDKELTKTVERIARRYATLCWWAEFDDLHQEGWVAALQARRTWDRRRGVPLAGYAGRAVALALRNYLWACRSPVTGRVNHGHVLAGTVSVPVETLLSFEAPSEQPEVEQWWRDVRSAMHTVILDGRGGEIAAMVLLGEQRHCDVAQRIGIPVARVRRFTNAARSRLKASERLRTLVAGC